jgi:hypothetical protein
MQVPVADYRFHESSGLESDGFQTGGVSGDAHIYGVSAALAVSLAGSAYRQAIYA